MVRGLSRVRPESGQRWQLKVVPLAVASLEKHRAEVKWLLEGEKGQPANGRSILTPFQQLGCKGANAIGSGSERVS